MKRREEKRRRLHEALLRTLYPPSFPPSSPPSPPPPFVDNEPFDVSLIDPEDYVKIGASDKEEDGEESESTQKLSRAQRKRLRKKKLKEEAVHRRKLIGPLLPSTMAEGVGVGGDANTESEVGCSEGDGSGEQSVRGNAQEKEDGSSEREKKGRVKKRRETRKRLKESSEPNRFDDHPTPLSQN